MKIDSLHRDHAHAYPQTSMRHTRSNRMVNVVSEKLWKKANFSIYDINERLYLFMFNRLLNKDLSHRINLLPAAIDKLRLDALWESTEHKHKD